MQEGDFTTGFLFPLKSTSPFIFFFFDFHCTCFPSISLSLSLSLSVHTQTHTMRLLCGALLLLLTLFYVARGDDPYRYFTWVVSYGPISPLGVQQQGILINGQFPGPRLDCVTNDNINLTVVNKIDEPLLITWNGIKQRKNSWQDGVLGTNCPIPPNSNYTYKFQTKDQIGGYTYFLSTGMQRAAGGFGALNVNQRPHIPVPYPPPAGDFNFLVGDWYRAGHKALQQTLDGGKTLPLPDGLLINGAPEWTIFTGDRWKTYLFRISNVGLMTSINFRIQNHKLKLVEVEGSHVIQNYYDSLDIHVGQSLSVLVTLNQAPKEYYIVASTRFTREVLTATGVLHYSGSNSRLSGLLPVGPRGGYRWSMRQARSFRWNLTANAARPNPQGSYHYGTIPLSRSVRLANSASIINGKHRYAVNGVSFVVPDTPLKLADTFNIPGVFTWDSLPGIQNGNTDRLDTPVVRFNLHDFVEVVFENKEKTIQTWHLDGYDFWVVGYGNGTWSEDLRKTEYNLVDAPTRHTVQVYPKGWSAILVSLDNQGMWNLRSAMWARQYLGQQFYIRVWNSEKSYSNEYDIPANALRCGKAVGIK